MAKLKIKPDRRSPQNTKKKEMKIIHSHFWCVLYALSKADENPSRFFSRRVN